MAQGTIKLCDTVKDPVRLSFSRETDADEPVDDVVAHHFALRVLINAWAFSGTLLVKDLTGEL